MFGGGPVGVGLPPLTFGSEIRRDNVAALNPRNLRFLMRDIAKKNRLQTAQPISACGEGLDDLKTAKSAFAAPLANDERVQLWRFILLGETVEMCDQLPLAGIPIDSKTVRRFRAIPIGGTPIVLYRAAEKYRGIFADGHIEPPRWAWEKFNLANRALLPANADDRHSFLQSCFSCRAPSKHTKPAARTAWPVRLPIIPPGSRGPMEH